MSPRHRKTDFYQADYWALPGASNWPLRPFCVEETSRSIPTWFKEENCPFMMFVLLLEGCVNYSIAGWKCSLRPGMLLVIPPASDYAFESESCGGHYHKMVVELKGTLLSALAASFFLDKPAVLDIQDAQAMAAGFRSLAEMMRNQREEDVPLVMGRVYEMLAKVARLCDDAQGGSRLFTSAKARLESRFDEPLPSSSLAASLGVSCATVNRLFRKRLCLSPQKLRRRSRLQYAMELLESSSLSVKEISARAGYCTQFYFANEFKRLVGLSPRDYRAKSRSATD